VGCLLKHGVYAVHCAVYTFWACWLSLQMVAVIGLSILFNVPRYLDDHVVRREDGSPVLRRTDLGNDDTFQLVYAGLLYYIVIYAVPMAVLTAMTYRRLILAPPSLFNPRVYQFLIWQWS